MKNIICPFCQELVEPKSIVGKNRIIAETPKFVVFPTTGGIVDNYQLIVPKEHINCFGELTLDELKELKEIIEWQKEINKNILILVFQCLNTEHYIHQMKVERALFMHTCIFFQTIYHYLMKYQNITLKLKK